MSFVTVQETVQAVTIEETIQKVEVLDSGDAVRWWGRALDNTAPSDGEVMAWDSATSEWVPTDVGISGFVQRSGDTMTGDLVMDDSDVNPLTDGEGSLGLTGTRWGNGFFDNLTVTNPLAIDISGNAATATALETARTINGVSFDGTANITVPAAAGTLTGATLAAGVTSSSLTSLGTLVNLTVTNPITGSVSGASGSSPAGSLTGNTLAAGVTASSLTSVGTLTSLGVTGTTASGLFDGPIGTGAATPAAGSFTTGAFSGVLSVTDTTEATSASSASIKTLGGLSTTKNIFLGGDTLRFNTAGATALILTPETETGTGNWFIQAGAGANNYGGAMRLYAHAHAVKPGDVAIGISNGSGGSFRVNSSGNDSGTDWLTVDGTGATFAFTLTSTGLLTASAGLSVTGAVTLGTPLAVTSGGIGIATVTVGDVLYASGTDTLAALAKENDGDVLTLASGIPSWAAGATAVGGTMARFTPGGADPNSDAITAPFSVITAATGDRQCLLFDKTTLETGIWSSVMARSYSGGGVTVEIRYSMSAANTSKVVQWEAAFEALADGSAGGAGGSDFAAVNVDSAGCPDAADEWQLATITFTDGADMDSVVAGSPFRFLLQRNPDGTDDADGDAQLHRVEIRETP